MGTSKDTEVMRAWRIARHPIGRFGEADEVATVFAFLSSAAAGFIAEAALVIDFGSSAV